MAEKSHGSGGGGAMRDLKWAILLLIVVWFIWYFTNGPQRYEATKPFINPPAPLGTGQVYGPQ